MDDLGLFDAPEPSDIPATLEEERPGSGSAAFFNLVSIVFLVLTVVAVLAVAGLFINPNLPYNIFPPDGGAGALPTAFVIPTLTPTVEVALLPPTWTPSVTPTSSEPAETLPPLQQGTPGPLPTIGQGGTPGPVPTAPPGQPTVSAFPFTLQEGAPAFTQNPEENGGCAGMFIAGQVFDLDGEPLDGIAVWVTGQNFETPDITKFNTQYGPGSFQIILNNAPIEAEFEVQLWTVQAQALSDKVVIRTRSTCEENLIFVNFVQNHAF